MRFSQRRRAPGPRTITALYGVAGGGHGRILGPGAVAVENGSEAARITARRIMIATGSTSASLPGVTPDGDRIGTSTEALGYPEVPGHLVVIGAGYIGLELGSVWRRLGAKVTVVEYLDRILPGMDGETSAAAKRIFETQGLAFPAAEPREVECGP